MTEQELFLKSLKEGKIIIADIEETEEGTKYYYIQKICWGVNIYKLQEENKQLKIDNQILKETLFGGNVSK